MRKMITVGQMFTDVAEYLLDHPEALLDMHQFASNFNVGRCICGWACEAIPEWSAEIDYWADQAKVTRPNMIEEFCDTITDCTDPEAEEPTRLTTLIWLTDTSTMLAYLNDRGWLKDEGLQLDQVLWEANR